MTINLTQTEKEIVSSSGGADFKFEQTPDGFRVNISADQANIIAMNFEELISFNESDHGDWIRATEWRAAKSELLNKLRRVVIS